jgi:hypothetical protein
MRNIILLSVTMLIGCSLTAAEPSGAPSERLEPGRLNDRAIAACGHDDDEQVRVLPASRRIAGRSQLAWTKNWWRWLLSIPAEQNPELVLDVDCGNKQDGPVFYLPGFSADVYTRTCQIPAHKFVLAPVWTILNDFPCPDPTFVPAPGQTLVDFLQQGAAAFLARVTDIQVTIDGVVVDYTSHRLTSGLFNFTGDASLTSTFDGCITGQSQQAVTDGWWLMLAPLPEGEHTMVVTAIAPSGRSTAQTFVLQVDE